jgi:predicted nucleic acid-binding protein
MNDDLFVDTNVLIYAIDSSAAEKSKSQRAKEILRGGTVCLSTQVLGEFYRATTSPRRASPLTHLEAVAWVQLWKRHKVNDITTGHVDLSLEICDRYGINYYDALIIAAARLAGCKLIYSEDLNHGQNYGGVRVENPFS